MRLLKNLNPKLNFENYLILIIFMVITFNSKIFCQSQFINLNNSKPIIYDGFIHYKTYNFPDPVVNSDGSIPGFAASLPWGCSYNSTEDFVFSQKNRKLINGQLNLEITKENILCPLTNVKKNWGAALLFSEETFRYGIFELTTTLPNVRNNFPAFWLFGGPNGKSPYNEIDVFEAGAGDWMVHCNHSSQPRKAECENTSTMPNTSFGGSKVTYSLRWEPNKIVWYINGQRVRTKIECDNELSITTVPSVYMNLLISNAYADNSSSTNYLKKGTNNRMIIHELKIFKFIQNSPTEKYEPKVNFSINEKRSKFCQNPVKIEYTNKVPIIIDLNDSYLPEHKFMYVLTSLYEDCIENETIHIGEYDFCNNYNNNYFFDLNKELRTENINLQSNSKYILKILPWVIDEYSIDFSDYNLFKTTQCLDKIDFNINTVKVCDDNICPSPYQIEDNHGKSRVILDLTNTYSCSNDIFISIESSNIFFERKGDEKFKWLSNTEIENKSNFDLEKFANENNLFFCPNQYYRLKVATYSENGWSEKLVLLYFNDCKLKIVQKINDLTGNIITVKPNDPIKLDLTDGELCSKNFTIQLKKVDANQEILIASKYYKFQDNSGSISGTDDYYDLGDIDLRNIGKPNYQIECNSEYKVTVILDEDICFQEMINEVVLKIDSCDSSNSEFYVRTDHCWEDEAFKYKIRTEINILQTANCLLWAPLLSSCNYKIKIELQEVGQLNLIEFYLTLNEIHILKNNGDLNLKELVYIRNLNYIENNKTYILRIIADPQISNSPVTMNNCNAPKISELTIRAFCNSVCCNPPIENPNLNILNLKEISEIICTPNPFSKNITLENTSMSDICLIEIIDIYGKNIEKINKIIHKNESLNLNFTKEIEPNIYFLTYRINDKLNVVKLVKIFN